MYTLSEFSLYSGEKLDNNSIVLTWSRADGYMFRKFSDVDDQKIVAYK